MSSETKSKPMLLIVDDEKPTRDGLRAALEDHYDVWTAEDAKAAAGLLEEQDFAVLLTDFRLPHETHRPRPIPVQAAGLHSDDGLRLGRTGGGGHETGGG
jgi:CheY-like chemotaxis protein